MWECLQVCLPPLDLSSPRAAAFLRMLTARMGPKGPAAGVSGPSVRGLELGGSSPFPVCEEFAKILTQEGVRHIEPTEKHFSKIGSKM